MKNAWVYIEKKGDDSNLIIRVEIYGSITEMARSEQIVVDDLKKSEGMLRILLKDGFFSNEKYLIIHRNVNRSKIKNRNNKLKLN